MVTAALVERLGAIRDPEIPVLTIGDLGVLRSVEETDDGLVVTITPTYSGCPAVEQMAERIRAEAAALGHRAEVRIVHSPAWTTDWMRDDARRRLAEYGIAPPEVAVTLRVRCPRCGSSDSETISRFSSTACKALMRCGACLEPFEHFKEI